VSQAWLRSSSVDQGGNLPNIRGKDFPFVRTNWVLIIRASRGEYSRIDSGDPTNTNADTTSELDELEPPPGYSLHPPKQTRLHRGGVDRSKSSEATYQPRDQKHAYSAVPIEEPSSDIQSAGPSTSASTSAQRPIGPEPTQEEIMAADLRQMYAALGRAMERSGSGYGFRDTGR
jgi:hypothetical protein